jgi:hypothetical protein
MRSTTTKVANNGITAEGRLSADEDNIRFREMEYACTTAGITLDTTVNTDQQMLAQAMARYASGGIQCQDSGVANAYILSGLLGFRMPRAYFDGMMLMFRPGHTNTGAATVNAFSIGSKAVLDATGTALAGGELVADLHTLLIYVAAANSGAGAFLIAPWAAQPIGGGSGGGGSGGGGGSSGLINIAGRAHAVSTSSYTVTGTSYQELWRKAYSPAAAGDKIVVAAGGEFGSGSGASGVTKRDILGKLEWSSNAGSTWTQIGPRMDASVQSSSAIFYETDFNMYAQGEVTVPIGAPELLFRIALACGSAATPSVSAYVGTFIDIIEYTA